MRRCAPLLLLAAAGCLTARGTPDQPVVTAVDLRGVRSVDRAELRDKLATRASTCFIGCEVAHLDRNELEDDRRRITAFYKERGRYQAAVPEPELIADGEGRVRVRFVVNEGPVVTVTRLLTPGLEKAPEAARALVRPALKVGATFTVEAYDGMRAQLLSALRSTGWALAEVTQLARVLPDLERVEVTYTVVPGPRLKFGPLQVTGTNQVPPGKVIDQASLEVERGALFDERALTRAQTRVFNLGVFSGTRLSTGHPDLERGEVPVVVNVQEAPFQTLRLGPGIAFQSSRWEVQGLASWTNRNFFGDLRKLQLQAQVGYAWLPTPVSPSKQGPVGQVTANFDQPGTFGRQVDLAAKLGAERSIEQAYAYWAVRGRVGTPLRLASRWTLIPSYNLENYWVDPGYDPADGSVPPQLQACNANRICLLSYFEERIAWDGRDDPVDTRRGYMLALTLQEGFRIGANGYDYLRVSPEASFYVPLGWRTVLAGRIRLGSLVPLNETGPASIVALFTSGGSNSIRGYGVQRLSPMALQEGDWVPTGGNGVLEASLELRQQLRGALGLVVFLDVGNVSEASGGAQAWQQVLDPSLLQPTAGLGIRYKTPFGPVRVDVGFRLPTDFRPGIPFEERFPTVPGDSGHREPLAAFHLTLGEAY
jgi:translocation and assembly module TamA